LKIYEIPYALLCQMQTVADAMLGQMPTLYIRDSSSWEAVWFSDAREGLSLPMFR